MVRRLVVALIACLVAGLLGTPAAAQTCGPPGGEPIPRADPPPGEFRLTGGGWGHGAGMSQYGAQGAARLGCDAQTILGVYFPGVSVEAAPVPSSVIVGLHSEAQIVNVEAVEGALPWELCVPNDEGGKDCTQLEAVQPQGTTWTVTVTPAGSYELHHGATLVWAGGDRFSDLRALLTLPDGPTRIIRLPFTEHRYKWGMLTFDAVTGPEAMFVTLVVTPFERYLRGIGEVPSSWPTQALRAQVIAARSYALARIHQLGIRTECRCHLYATVRDQHYTGYDQEADDASVGGGWVAAVDATAGVSMRYGGEPAEAFYNSSNGGQSESGYFVFGTDVAYLPPVDDSRWDRASDNPNRTWTATFTADQVGAAAGVGRATGWSLPEPRGAGGRVGDPARGAGGVRITGTTGTVTMSGAALRTALGLRSTMFDVVTGSLPPPEGRVTRLSGSDRIATAVAVSSANWPEASDAVIATAGTFPDALAGVPLAARLDAPLLLTGREGLDARVAAELDRLGVDRVWLLGGQAALSAAVAEAAGADGREVRRLAGTDRYATAAAIAEAAGPADSGDAVLALGTDFPDAVAAGAFAGTADPPPTLLTPRETLSAEASDALETLHVERVLIVGGSAVVSEAVALELIARGYEVQRLAGPNRYATSAVVAGEALARIEGEVPIVFASGQAFPDALSAGALAGRIGGPLLLVPRDDLGDAPEAGQFVTEHAERFTRGVLVGGTAAVSAQVDTQLEDRLGP